MSIGERCQYSLCGECQLYNQNCNIESEQIDRLVHIATCQEQIICKQKEIIDEIFELALMHVSADADEMKPIVADINELSQIRTEI